MRVGVGGEEWIWKMEGSVGVGGRRAGAGTGLGGATWHGRGRKVQWDCTKREVWVGLPLFSVECGRYLLYEHE